MANISLLTATSGDPQTYTDATCSTLIRQFSKFELGKQVANYMTKFSRPYTQDALKELATYILDTLNKQISVNEMAMRDIAEFANRPDYLERLLDENDILQMQDNLEALVSYAYWKDKGFSSEDIKSRVWWDPTFLMAYDWAVTYPSYVSGDATQVYNVLRSYRKYPEAQLMLKDFEDLSLVKNPYE